MPNLTQKKLAMCSQVLCGGWWILNTPLFNPVQELQCSGVARITDSPGHCMGTHLEAAKSSVLTYQDGLSWHLHALHCKLGICATTSYHWQNLKGQFSSSSQQKHSSWTVTAFSDQ